MTAAVASLGDVAGFVNGVAFKPADWTNVGRRIIRIQNLTDETKPYNRTTRRVADKYLVRPGDLLVSWSASLGVFTWEHDDVALVNQHIFRVEPDPTLVDKSYLKHMLGGALADMERHLHGATMKHVNRSEFLATEIPLPSLAEQRRIARILDRVTEMRAAVRSAAGTLSELRSALYESSFGPNAQTAKHWPVESVMSVCELVVDCVNRTAPLSPEPSPFKMIRTSNVRNGRVDLSSVRYVDNDTFLRWNRRATPMRGDVLLTREAPVGEVGLLQSDEPVFLGQRLMLYRVDQLRMTSEYLVDSFRSPFLRGQFAAGSSGSTVTHLPLPTCRGLELVVPPLDLQREYSTTVRRIERQREAYEHQLSNIEAFQRSLQLRAFGGAL